MVYTWICADLCVYSVGLIVPIIIAMLLIVFYIAGLAEGLFGLIFNNE